MRCRGEKHPQIETKRDKESPTIWSEQGYFSFKSSCVNIIFRVVVDFRHTYFIWGGEGGRGTPCRTCWNTIRRESSALHIHMWVRSDPFISWGPRRRRFRPRLKLRPCRRGCSSKPRRCRLSLCTSEPEKQKNEKLELFSFSTFWNSGLN